MQKKFQESDRLWLVLFDKVWLLQSWKLEKQEPRNPVSAFYGPNSEKMVKIHKIEGNVEEKSCFPTMAAIVPEQKNKCKTWNQPLSDVRAFLSYQKI